MSTHQALPALAVVWEGKWEGWCYKGRVSLRWGGPVGDVYANWNVYGVTGGFRFNRTERHLGSFIRRTVELWFP